MHEGHCGRLNKGSKSVLQVANRGNKSIAAEMFICKLLYSVNSVTHVENEQYMLTCPCWSIYVLYTLKMALTTACNNMYPRYGQPVRMFI